MTKLFDTSGYVQRPSEKEGRIARIGSLGNQSSDQTIFTVTAGKTLYVTNIILSWFNTHATLNGLLEIQDNITLKIPAVLPPTTAGNDPIPSSNISMSFAEPITFVSSFRVVIAQGTIRWAVSFAGYEE